MVWGSSCFQWLYDMVVVPPDDEKSPNYNMNLNKRILVLTKDGPSKEFYEKIIKQTLLNYGFVQHTVQHAESGEHMKQILDAADLGNLHAVLELGGAPPGDAIALVAEEHADKVMQMPVLLPPTKEAEEKKAAEPPPPPRFPPWPEKIEREAVIDKIQAWLKNQNEAPDWFDDAAKVCGLVDDFSDNEDRRLLYLLNPAAGPKKGVAMYEAVVKPLLGALGFKDIKCVQTQHRNHATEIAEAYDLDSVDAILISGGDGTISEVYRGLLNRKDGKSRVDFPVGLIPGGSANGVFSQLDEYIEPVHPAGPRDYISSVLRVASWNHKPLDIMEIQYDTTTKGTKHDLVVLLMLAGHHAQTMVGAHKLRWTNLGVLRYPISAMFNVLAGHDYPMDVSYLPGDADEDAPPFDEWKQSDNWKTVKGPLQEMTLFSTKFRVDPRDSRETLHDGLMWLWMAKGLDRQRMLGEVVRHGIHFYNYDKPELPDGIWMTGAKAVCVTLNADGLDEWKGEMQLDAELMPKDIHMTQVRARIADQKSSVFY